MWTSIVNLAKGLVGGFLTPVTGGIAAAIGLALLGGWLYIGHLQSEVERLGLEVTVEKQNVETEKANLRASVNNHSTLVSERDQIIVAMVEKSASDARRAREYEELLKEISDAPHAPGNACAASPPVRAVLDRLRKRSQGPPDGGG